MSRPSDGDKVKRKNSKITEENDHRKYKEDQTAGPKNFIDLEFDEEDFNRDEDSSMTRSNLCEKVDNKTKML